MLRSKALFLWWHEDTSSLRLLSDDNSDTQNSETLPNSASISGLLKKITLTTIFHGASFHQDRPTTAQTKDATSASKKNYSSSADPNYHHPINVMNSCPHAATETKRYCVTIDLSIEINRHAYYANL